MKIPRLQQRSAHSLAKLLLVLVASGTLYAAAVSPSPELKLDHPGNRLAGLKVIGFSEGVLSLEASNASESLLVIFSQQPMLVKSALNAQATLLPGWDGTLGYSYYGLKVRVLKAGPVTIRLEFVRAPSVPFTDTPKKIEAFKKTLAERHSRFPNEPDEFRRWQDAYRIKLASWLMNGGLPKKIPLAPRVLAEQAFPTFTLRTVTYRSQEDRTNTALLSLPKEAGRVPLLLVLHGHEAPWGKANPEAYRTGQTDDICAYFAERGWAVLQPATMDHRLQHRGWTLQGEWTWDAVVALDYAATVPGIDMQRVAVCGLSTGGYLAMNVLALDPRVRAGVVAGSLTSGL